VPPYVPEDLIHPLDHYNSPDFIADPIAYWDALRDRFRVFWSPLLGGFWCLTRYDDIHAAFQQADLFSSRITSIPGREVRLLPISLDPPEHTKYRRVLNRPLAPVAVEELSLQIRRLCSRLVDGVVERGGIVDFMDALAQPLPTTVFCKLLGLPVEDVERFLEWNYAVLHVQGTPEGIARFNEANEELNRFLNGLVAQRRESPSDDLVSMLLDSSVDGRSLTHEEVLDTTYLLFMAGLDTVTAALGLAWKFLAEHPTHRRQIVDDPSLIPNAVEELLRCFSFVEDCRTLTRDAEFAGVAMRAGDRIMLPTSSAGRDEAQFPDAATVDFHREPTRQLAFAAGPHRCVGSHLARAELHIAMEEWHRRITDYRIPEGASVAFHGGAVVGIDTLPLEILAAR
jgi:cytochrome P450